MRDHLHGDAAALQALIADNESWLIDRILHYAKRQGYTRYTSTLREAWRQSIAGLSAPLLTALQAGMPDVELCPDEDYTADPLTRFGIIEAKRHQERGIEMGMFMGLMKYYRQSYMDLVHRESWDPERHRRIARIVERFFDRIEIGLVTAWYRQDQDEQLAELRRTNRAITNEKNKYVTILESIQSPVAVLDQNGHIDTVNHAWANLFQGQTTPGADYYEALQSSCPPEWLSAEIDACLSNGESENSSRRQVETPRGRRDLSIKIKRMLDVSEKFSGWVVILDDITQQQQAESALMETTIWLTEMFNALEEAVFIVTPEGRIVDANRAARRIFGYAAAELKHRSTRILHEDSQHFEKFSVRVREMLAENENAVLEYTARRKNGEVFPIVVTIARLKKTDGTPLGIVSVLRDISDQKQAEATQRERERLQGALELAGAVCHDLNQPLMAITGYAELILMECPHDAHFRSRLQNLVDLVAKMGSITKKLMHVTRYETKPYLGQQIIDIDKASRSE